MMCEMSRGRLLFPPMVFIIVTVFQAVSEEAVQVSCRFGLSCVLPCSFQPATDIVIHWIQVAMAGAHVHSYYYNNNQLKHQPPQFQGRTSLYTSQISRGNASLLLKDILVEDGGQYKCYTSTVLGYTEQMIDLLVNAPVTEVTVSRTDEGFSCSSEGVYPQPELTWSTRPPSHHLHNQSSVELHRSAAGLVSVHSSLSLPHGDRSVSCSVQTRSNQRKTTLMPPASVQVRRSAARLCCTPPAAAPVSVTWSFNHTHVLIWSSDPGLSRVSEKWKEYVKESQSGFKLTLKDISPQHEGRYVCEARSLEETLITEIDVEMEKRGHGIFIGVLLAGSALALALTGVSFCVRRKRPGRKPGGEDEETTSQPLRTL